MARLILPPRTVQPVVASNIRALWNSVPLNGLYDVDSAGNILRLAGTNPRDYKLIVHGILTGASPYVPTAGVAALLILCLGAGGNGGSSSQPGGGAVAASGGGGAGGLSMTLLTTNVGGNHDFALGVLGSNPTQIEDNLGTIVCLANNGINGADDSAAAAPRIGALGGDGGAISGAVGDLVLPGQSGEFGMALGTAQAAGGVGAASILGSGGQSRTTTGNGNDVPTGSYGSGAGGGVIISTGASNSARGLGGGGLIYIWEFA